MAKEEQERMEPHLHTGIGVSSKGEVVVTEFVHANSYDEAVAFAELIGKDMDLSDSGKRRGSGRLWGGATIDWDNSISRWSPSGSAFKKVD